MGPYLSGFTGSWMFIIKRVSALACIFPEKSYPCKAAISRLSQCREKALFFLFSFLIDDTAMGNVSKL